MMYVKVISSLIFMMLGFFGCAIENHARLIKGYVGVCGFAARTLPRRNVQTHMGDSTKTSLFSASFALTAHFS
jgi:hypothetical protein